MDFDVITDWNLYIDAIANFGINTSEISVLDLNDGNK